LAEAEKTTVKTPKPQSKNDEQNLLAALTYILGFVTGLIFLVIEKKNDYIRFHALQSVAVFGSLFVLLLIVGFIPLINNLVFLVVILSLVLWVVLMYKAFTGERYKLPYVGEWVEKQLKNV